MRVQVRAAVDGDRLVARHAELHADALEQRLGQLEDAGAPVGGDRLGRGRGPGSLRPRCDRAASEPIRRALPQPAPCACVFQLRLDEQAART